MTAAILLRSTALVAFGVVIGIVVTRTRADRTVRNPRLWWAMAAFLLALNTTITTDHLIVSGDHSQNELDCRADLASPVNSATADLGAGTGRGLAVVTGLLFKDPKVLAAVKAKLGSAGTDELTRQITAILAASDRLAEANKNRGDPVTKCK